MRSSAMCDTYRKAKIHSDRDSQNRICILAALCVSSHASQRLINYIDSVFFITIKWFLRFSIIEIFIYVFGIFITQYVFSSKNCI